MFELLETVEKTTDVYTWGHPNLNGKIAMTGNKTGIFQAFDIPTNQWVELRVVFQSKLLHNTMYAKRIPSNGLQIILAEEESFQRKGELQPKMQLFFLIFPILAVMLSFIILGIRFGREPKTNYKAEYEREIPYDYSPAVVSALMDQIGKKPNANDFVAVIFDLCHKGHMKINVVKKKKILGVFGSDKDYEIIFQDKEKKKLTNQERTVMKILKGYSKENDLL